MYLLPKVTIEIPVGEISIQNSLSQVVLEKDIEQNYALSNISENKNKYLFIGYYSNHSFTIEEMVRFFPTLLLNRAIFKPFLIKGALSASGNEVEMSFQYPLSNYISIIVMLLLAGGLFYVIRLFFAFFGSESFNLIWFNLIWLVFIIYYVIFLIAFNLKVKSYKDYFCSLL